ncbi:MAG: hypothetical protein WBG86_12500 [Polyangiales bacterium]
MIRGGDQADRARALTYEGDGPKRASQARNLLGAVQCAQRKLVAEVLGGPEALAQAGCRA